MSNSGLLSTAVLLLTATVWVTWFTNGRLRSNPHDDASAWQATAPLLPVEPPATFVPVHGRHQLFLQDSSGAPVAAAELWLAPARARVLDPSHCRKLAQAEHDGVLPLPAAPPQDGTELLVRAVGYRAAALPAIAAAASIRVELRRSTTARVRCVRADGTPLAEARVVLARAAAPPADDERLFGLSPGADPRSAIYAANTDASGVAVVEGLSPGRYELDLFQRDHVPAPGQAVPHLDVPGPDLEVRMVDALGCVLTPPPDDEIEATSIAIEHGSLRADVATMAASRRVEAHLRRRHPGTFAHVVPGTGDGGARSVRGKALLRRGGWQVFTVELMPLHSLVEARLPVVNDAPVPLAELRISTVQANAPRLSLMLSHTADGITCHVPLPLDTPVHLPGGTYTFDAENAIVRALLPKEKLTLTSGQAVVVPLHTGEWQAVDLRVTTASDDWVGACSIEVGQEDKKPYRFVVRDARHVPLVLPRGRIALSVAASGFERTQVTLTVPDDVPQGTCTLRLAYVD